MACQPKKPAVASLFIVKADQTIFSEQEHIDAS